MGHGSAAVTPSNSNITEHEDAVETSTSLPRVPQGTSLISVQSDSSVLSKVSKDRRHRRHSSMFSIFSNNSIGKQYSEDGGSPSTTNNTTSPKKTASARLKWDWKLGDLWHTRSGKLTDSRKSLSPITDPVSTQADLNIDSGESAVLCQNGPREEGSLHYTSLGIFQSSKFSSSDFETSDRSGSSQSEVEDSRVPLAIRWREIQGLNNWDELLDPLDLDLRRELLRYGDFAQMCYDNFEDKPWSKYVGSAKYSKQNVFEKLQKPDTGYQVTRYLYATCENPLPGVVQSSLSSSKWDVQSNWMGFVAVAVDPKEIQRLGRRDIVVSWRGTMETIEWLVDAQIQLAPMTLAPDPQAGNEENSKPATLKPKVEKGFWSLYTCKRSSSQFNQRSASEQVIRELSRLLTLYKGETLSITITGHSLGGVLAILTAYEVAEKGLNKLPSQNLNNSETIPVTVFSFGSPRIGDAVFKKRFEELELKALRVVNVHDVVPKCIGGIHPPWSDAYRHVGVELQVNHKLSTYMKRTRDPVDWHSLEGYLHLIDGYQGSKSKEFKLMTGRDYALLNKYSDVLIKEYCIPGRWWQAENMGLVLSSEGKWIEPDRAQEDLPSLDNREGFV